MHSRNKRSIFPVVINLCCSDYAIVTSYRYLDCVELDKFEPFDSEYLLEQRSVSLIKNGTYWAAIVFNDSLVGAQDLPSHVSYKIRMNTDKVGE